MIERGVRIAPWKIEIPHWESAQGAFYESILAQGNGYLGVRGFDPLAAKANLHERSVFSAGFFEYIKPGLTDLVNLPDLFSVRLLRPCRELEAQATLDLRSGLLTRRALWIDEQGRRFLVVSRRLLSMDQRHAAALKLELTPLDAPLKCSLETGLDGEVANLPIADDQLALNTEIRRLLSPVVCRADQAGGTLVMESGPSGRRIYQAYRVAADLPLDRRPIYEEAYSAVCWTVVLEPGQTLTITKLISTYVDGHDPVDHLEQAERLAGQLADVGFDGLLKRSTDAWAALWKQCDVKLAAAPELQGALRYNIFQLLQNNASWDPRVSMGARGLLHGRYKGNYFWDTEIFMLPFFLYTRPEAAKNLLLYRYHTLSGAREGAQALGLQGARYPWMSSLTGREQCESWDIGGCEVHVTADVAYALQEYVRVSGDLDFVLDYGAEILLETARYWVSRLTYCASSDSYSLLFVKGPDEYCGVTHNNTYTNVLIQQNLWGAVRLVRIVQRSDRWPKFAARLDVSEAELQEFEGIAERIVVLHDQERDLFLQDEVFERLEHLDLSAQKEGASPLYRTISYDRLQRYKVLKQADLVLLMTLLPNHFTEQQQQQVWSHYEPLTLHDSSLSFGTHAQLAFRLGLTDAAFDYFRQSVFLDLHNLMDNTQKEGIHLAALGASWQAAILGMAGLTVGEDGPQVNPNLPPEIHGMRFSVVIKGRTYQIDLVPGTHTIRRIS